MQGDKKLRIAIIHDWLVGGGAELVVEQLHKMFPEAPIYTSYASREWRKRLDNKVHTGWLQYLGPVRKFVPFLRIFWFTHLKLNGYDLVISSSGAEAKGIKVPRGTIHVNYCHAPTHYYWSRYDQYIKQPGFGPFDWLARIGLRLLVSPLRRWDRKAAQRPDYMLANSTHIQSEIKKYYGRDSTVIHPPVNLERFQKPRNRKLTSKGFLVSGRQTPYKRFDIAVEACSTLDLPLTVIGDGPDHKRLRSLAGKSITFLGRVSDEVMEEELASAEALIFPNLDDFGITPLEAMASGTPVIAYKAGGALDYVLPGKNGIFFDKPTTASLATALQEFKPDRFSSAAIAVYTQRFSAEQFRTHMVAYLKKVFTASRDIKSHPKVDQTAVSA
jgi:glycosyltransferase involved in cell wall biosynthesis